MAWLRAEDDVFLLGSDLLIAPQFDADPIREPVLPRRAWHELTLFDRDERGARNSDLPRLYQRGDSDRTARSARPVRGSDVARHPHAAGLPR